MTNWLNWSVKFTFIFYTIACIMSALAAFISKQSYFYFFAGLFLGTCFTLYTMIKIGKLKWDDKLPKWF
jgi:hypothetical protein